MTGKAAQARVGTGQEAAGAARRVARIDGETIATTRLADITCPLWLTPAQDRLFLEGAAERRRFFDRLVFAARPDHAGALASYEKALRERTRLLAEPSADPAWIAVLEREMARSGALVAQARAATLAELAAEIEARPAGAFPKAGLALSGHWEQPGRLGGRLGGRRGDTGSGTPEETAAIEVALAEALAASRARDAAAGRALAGPHRGDLLVTHLGRGRPAGECSTGEQKALVLNLVLAQAGRLSRAKSRPNPILLLDEVAAHLDPARRAALFDEIEALGLQAFLTGTEAGLFRTLEGRALGVHVDDSRLDVTDPAP